MHWNAMLRVLLTDAASAVAERSSKIGRGFSRKTQGVEAGAARLFDAAVVKTGPRMAVVAFMDQDGPFSRQRDDATIRDDHKKGVPSLWVYPASRPGPMCRSISG